MSATFVKLVLFALAVLPSFVLGVPLSNGNPLVGRQRGSNRAATKGGNKNTGTGNNAAATTGTAADGSVVVDDTVTINGLNMRFRVSGPKEAFISNTANAAATATTNATATGNLGINVLFHGDGGQSFLDFPNQGVQNGLMGVALLSPDKNRRWGGGSGLDRPDGPAHSAAVNEFITNVLPTMLNFDKNQIFLEGVSGGSLMLAGFTIPQFAASLGVKGAVLGCGGLAPQTQVQGNITNLRLHFQSTQNEQTALKTSIPQSITAYQNLVSDITADASPNGGHCEFDQKNFVSGVQLLTDNFASIISGQGALNGKTVTNKVANANSLFAGGRNAAAGTGNNRNAAATTAATGRGGRGRGKNGGGNQTKRNRN